MFETTFLFVPNNYIVYCFKQLLFQATTELFQANFSLEQKKNFLPSPLHYLKLLRTMLYIYSIYCSEQLWSCSKQLYIWKLLTLKSSLLFGTTVSKVALSSIRGFIICLRCWSCSQANNNHEQKRTSNELASVIVTRRK